MPVLAPITIPTATFDSGFMGSNNIMPYADINTLQGVMNNSLAYQKHLEEREDSAYQRMVADMKKAGLNPWIGINSGGLSASPYNGASVGLNDMLNIMSAYNTGNTSGSKSKQGWFNIITKLLGLGLMTMSNM